jgi:hypothetical protein
MSHNIQIANTLVYSFNKIIIDDHNNFLKHIYQKYGKLGGFTLEQLYDRYHIDSILLRPDNKSTSIPNTPEPEYRCMARCWGGSEFVKYDKHTKKWSYGYQCHRTKLNDTNYCGIHLREIINNKHLTHGRIDSSVPHPHYNKYKMKIEFQQALKKKQNF